MSRRERFVVVCGLPGAGKTTVSREYAELLDRAAAAVDEHGVVVLDGTFRLKHLRAAAREEVADVGAIFELVKVECSAEVVRERITAREGDESDADFAVHELLAEEFEAVGAPDLRVDNSGDLPRTREQVAAYY